MERRLAGMLCLLFAAALPLYGCVEMHIAQPAEPPSVTTSAVTAAPAAEAAGVTIKPLSLGAAFAARGGVTLTMTEKVDAADTSISEVTLTAQSGAGETAVTTEGYFEQAYYVENPNGACVVLSVDESGTEYYKTYVYALAGDSLVLTSKAGGYAASLAGDPGSAAVTVTLCNWVDILGSYRASYDYALNAQFVLEPAGDGLWHVLDDGDYRENIDYYTLTAMRTIPVQTLENGRYRDAIVGPGQAIRVTAWDGEGTVSFVHASDGSCGRLFVVLEKETDEWGRAYLIDGVAEFECFEEVPYAG